MKSIIMVLIPFLLVSVAIAQRDSGTKLDTCRFDFDQPSFFLNGFFEGGGFGENTISNLGPRGPRSNYEAIFNCRYSDPTYNLWRDFSVFQSNAKPFIADTFQLFVTNRMDNKDGSYVIRNSLFLNWSLARRVPDQVLISHFNRDNRISYTESEEIVYDNFYNPIIARHFYNGKPVYQDSIFFDYSSNNSCIRILRFDFKGNSLGVQSKIQTSATQCNVKYTYSKPWKIFFPQRPDSSIFYFDGPRNILDMMEMHYDSSYIFRNNNCELAFNLHPEYIKPPIQFRKISIFSSAQSIEISNFLARDNSYGHSSKTRLFFFVNTGQEKLVDRGGQIKSVYFFKQGKVAKIENYGIDVLESTSTFSYSYPYTGKLIIQ